MGKLFVYLEIKIFSKLIKEFYFVSDSFTAYMQQLLEVVPPPDTEDLSDDLSEINEEDDRRIRESISTIF